MVWNRRLWMRLGVINALCSLAISLYAIAVPDPIAQSVLRLGATFQFMHSMSTFACATFMNIGAHAARHAPAWFLAGSALFSGSLYAQAFNLWSGGDVVLALGGAMMAAGWGVLFVSGWTIDPHGEP